MPIPVNKSMSSLHGWLRLFVYYVLLLYLHCPIFLYVNKRFNPQLTRCKRTFFLFDRNICLSCLLCSVYVLLIVVTWIWVTLCWLCVDPVSWQGSPYTISLVGHSGSKTLFYRRCSVLVVLGRKLRCCVFFYEAKSIYYRLHECVVPIVSEWQLLSGP